MPRMPVEERVHLRWIETGEVRHLFPMSFYPRSIQRELEGRPLQTQGRVCDAPHP